MLRCSQRQVNHPHADDLQYRWRNTSSRKENEMETDDAHERRLTQALLALALFLNYFETSKQSELTAPLKRIFDSGKFWKLDKIKSIQVMDLPSLSFLSPSKWLFSLDSKFLLPLSLRVDQCHPGCHARIQSENHSTSLLFHQ